MNRFLFGRGLRNILFPEKCWYQVVEEAAANLMDTRRRASDIPVGLDDIDAGAVRDAREDSARLAGVDHMIHFSAACGRDFAIKKEICSFIAYEPPYGERLKTRNALPGLFRELERKLSGDWSTGRVSDH